MTIERRGLAMAALAAYACTLLSGCSYRTTEPASDGNPAGVQISGVTRDLTYRGTEPAEPYQMPDITLRADNGNPFNLIRDTAYPVTLVFFGYTHCPDACPLILNGLAATYRRLPPAVRAETQVLFVTTDPARDTDAALRAYLARFDASFVGLSGSSRDILAAAESMGVPVSGIRRLPDGGYEVGHGVQVIGFRGNEAPVIWTEGTPVAAMVTDVVALARKP